VELIDHLEGTEAFADEGAAGLAEAPAQVGVSGQAQEAILQAGQIAGAKEEAGFIIEAHLVGAVGVIGDDGASGGVGLGQSPGQSFAH
jgi:hypothetical protein